LEEEQKINTHLTCEATFLCCTYPLFVVRHASPLDGQREREVELGKREGGGRRERERERQRESESETNNKERESETECERKGGDRGKGG
jgi:hypothetical protein